MEIPPPHEEEQLTKLPFIDSREFYLPDAEQHITQAPAQIYKPASRLKPTSDMPREIADLYEVPLFTPEGERYSFRLMNFRLFQRYKIEGALSGNEHATKTFDPDRRESIEEEAQRLRQDITMANLRLAAHMAKKVLRPGEDFSGVFSEMNVSLLRCVRTFDYMRDFKFSTYTCNSMLRNYSRAKQIPYWDSRKFQGEGTTRFEEDITEDPRENLQGIRMISRGKLIALINRLEDPRLQGILQDRFALNGSPDARTLEEVGHALKITKERTRQLEARALKQLAGIVRDNALDEEDFFELLSLEYAMRDGLRKEDC